jgi:FAD-dependent oxidoreductase domain-containing protein 1
MGLSSAYFIKKMSPTTSVCVVERDSTYKMASAPLSVSSIRQQFSLVENIKLSQWSAQFLQNMSEHLSVPGEDLPDPQFIEGGYLFLAGDKGEHQMRENYKLQRSLGVDVILLTPQQLQERYPWMNTDGIALASLGVKNEGWFDPWSLLVSFRKKARHLGVKILDGNVVGMVTEDYCVKHVKVLTNHNEEVVLDCGHVVNACGPWAGDVARMAGIGDDTHPNPLMHTPLPVVPLRRQVFVFHSPGGPVLPLMVEPTHHFVRSQSTGLDNMYICGKSIDSEAKRKCVNQPLDDPVDYDEFDELWSVFASRVPSFENLKVTGSWVGYYEYNTLDQNGIFGRHPVIKNFVFVNGFSGHGIQQCPAAGRAVAEVILEGDSASIDLRRMYFDRIISQEPFTELNVV